MCLLLIDKFDSFTYNLVHCCQVLKQEVHVLRSNACTLSISNALNPRSLIIGPGPGHPSQALISKELMLYYAGKIPILGVCLGHQCLGEIYGGLVTRALRPMHGKISRIYHDGQGIFSGLPQGFKATRYHSLIVERSTLPSCLEISAETDEGEIMGLRHRQFNHCESVQFHPESILTEEGKALLNNFVKY